MPDAARISDMHACPKVEPGPVPHVGGPIFSGSANVIIGSLPAARVNDSVVCFPIGPADSIQRGSTTVVINSRAAARKTDPCAHGGQITAGCPTVIIGDSPQSFTLRAAARLGTPFCEECERERKQMDDTDDSAKTEASAKTDPDTALLTDVQTSGEGDAYADDTLGRSELAAQPDQGDGLDDLRQAARYAVAFEFYATHAAARIKPSRIWSHLGGIDITKPVEVIDVSGKTMYQRGMPGGGDGQYFSPDPEVPPEKLGTSTMVYPIKDGVPTPPPVPRDRRSFEFGEQPALGLKSTSAAIDDTWSMPQSATDPGQVVACEGGGTQIMIPSIFHAGARATRS